MKQNGTGWCKMEQNGTTWNKLDHNGTKWNKMESSLCLCVNSSKLVQIEQWVVWLDCDLCSADSIRRDTAVGPSLPLGSPTPSSIIRQDSASFATRLNLLLGCFWGGRSNLVDQLVFTLWSYPVIAAFKAHYLQCHPVILQKEMKVLWLVLLCVVLASCRRGG